MPSDGFSQTRREEGLLRHISDVVVELRPDGRITFVSQAVERILGRPVSYFVGMSLLEAIIPDNYGVRKGPCCCFDSCRKRSNMTNSVDAEEME